MFSFFSFTSTRVYLPTPGRHRQVVICHNGCRHMIRITRHGKLVLKK